jgi:hypothetical protein
MAEVPPERDDYRSEPLMTRAGIVSAATLAVDAVVAFFPSARLSDSQRTIIVGLVSVVGTVAAAWWARRHVYSPETVQRLMAAKGRTAPAPVVPPKGVASPP